MTFITTSQHDRRRRILALLLFGWLNLLVQPCLAELPPMPAGMENCDHGGTPDHAVPCAEMRAADCDRLDDFNADGARSGESPRAGVLIEILPLSAATQAIALAAPDDPGGGATPLHIRYCNLRN